MGKTVIKGQILGYKPEYGVTLRYYDSPWFFMYFTGKDLKIAEDGTFRYETEVLLPSGATLWISRSKIELFLVPVENWMSQSICLKYSIRKAVF